MRLLFAGTPEVSIPALRALLDSPHEVVAVLTRADARAGRGRRLVPSPVKAFALDHGLPVVTTRPRAAGFLDELTALAPEACPVVAYGEILPAEVLRAVPQGWINLHFSLLPAWRGAAPVQRAIIAGDEITGASTFRIEEGLDTGPVLGTMTERVLPDDTSGSLLTRLAEGGGSLLVATIDGLESGDLEARPQPLDGVTLAAKLTPDDARIRWSEPALAVSRRIRGCTPAPGAWTTVRGERLKVGPPRPGGAPHGHPLAVGEVLVDKSGVHVGCADGPLTLGEVTPPGKRPMPAADWARGARLDAGEVLGDERT